MWFRKLKSRSWFQILLKILDVRIRLGEVPITLSNCRVKGVFYQAIKDDFIFRMDQVAAFRICNGAAITIEPFSGGHRELMRVFLLGSVFGALLHQKGILAIHGSAVATEDGALCYHRTFIQREINIGSISQQKRISIYCR